MPEFVWNKSGDLLDERVYLDSPLINSIIIETLSNDIGEYAFRRSTSCPQSG
jgi:hypothetical protein